LCVLLCAEQGDSDADADWMAGKLARLRIFRDEQDKMNRSVQDINGEALVISQFTLAGETSKGNRPSFINAAPPEKGSRLYERVCETLARDHHVPVKKGIFGAMMLVELVNDGPVTLIVRTERNAMAPA
jgi:D-aminoacyl-tRNA deacylase